MQAYLDSNERSYVQNQRILRIYSDFSFEYDGQKTEYMREKSNIKLIEKYNFRACFIHDSLAKNVSNICRIIRLFAVGNTNIVENSFDYNGFQLLDMCFEGKKLNCAGCSVVLNDILLTLGYKSKCICCIPFDTEDLDTHVVVHVFDEINNRWFVADPALGQVPCDKHGECMDILGLRQYLSEENELPFFRSGRLVTENIQCQKYAETLIRKVFLFMIFKNSGLKYDFKTTQIIVPKGKSSISSLYSVSEKTNNAIVLY